MRDLERLLEHLEALAERREREPEARDSSSFQAAPIPSQARPPDRTSSVVAAFTHSAGVAVVDATDHQAEPGALRLGGHEAERRPALEHRLLGPADAPDLEEMVHHPDRIEADVVGLAGDPGEGRADGRRAAGPRERADLEADLHSLRSVPKPWSVPDGEDKDRPARQTGRPILPPMSYITANVSATSTVAPPWRTGQPLASSTAWSRLSALRIV